MFGRTNTVRHDPPHHGAHSALNRTESSLARKMLLGMLAIAPVLVMAFIVAASIAPGIVAGQLPQPIAEVVVGSGWWLAGLVTWCVAIGFAIMVLKSDRIIVEKLIWCAAFLIFPMISVIVFWFIAIFREKSLVEILPIGELGNVAPSDQANDRHIREP